ncbi:hypothetical protein GPJ56_010158 [Histomonas meleagridis]|uniref:uncharacterized protein n=1 Tax=Histomonas meleagridis TaxID=135588 RepID=UPI00355A8F8F|nr:hypothetical protein GPJ56_010158 [Histomonas meleagridis]KAH0804694.1 hypothetical protein GO595_002388 [Histomonas meleagridis]
MVDQFKDNAENAKQQQENEEIAKLAIKTQGKYDKFGGERHKFNAQMQLLGREISQKVTQIYSHFEQFENDDKTVGNNESSKHELQRLLKHMGQDFETEWTNEDLCNYLNSLRLICDELIEMEHLEKETSKAIQSYLEPK